MAERKSRRRKEARPDEIVAAALQEFAEKGYAGTSMGSIAERAEIARSTIYLYFADKEALITRLFEDRVGAVFDEIQDLPDFDEGGFEASFRDMLNLVYSRILVKETFVLLRLLIAEGQQFPELIHKYHETILRRGVGQLHRIIQAGIASGELRPMVADYDPKLIMAPVFLAGIWQLTFDAVEPIDLPRYIEGHVDIVTRGLLAQQDGSAG